MLNQSSNGIVCDRCYTQYTDEFRYFSWDIWRYAAKNNQLPQHNRRSTPTFSLDICDGCMQTLQNKVVEKYKPTEARPHRVYPKGIYCELSGARMYGNFTYYHIHITEVKVSITGKLPQCAKCGAKADTEGPCSHCGSLERSKKADVVASPDYLEIIVCEESYEHLKKKAADLRQNTEHQQWS